MFIYLFIFALPSSFSLKMIEQQGEDEARFDYVTLIFNTFSELKSNVQQYMYL